MEKNAFTRLQMLVGKSATDRLQQAKVAVLGVGGVGGFAAEALARSAVGSLTLIDYASVDITNINRQVIALQESVGKIKVELMKERIRSIHPGCQVQAQALCYKAGDFERLGLQEYDYIIDAIDMLPSKIDLITQAYQRSRPIISSMGMGFKLDPSKLQVADLYATHACPLARHLRRELKKRQVKHLKTVFSTELPAPLHPDFAGQLERQVPASSAFVPASAGLLLASQVVQDLLQKKEGEDARA